jgi:hypothetical protein
MAVDFEKQSYWHDRFATETSFEWLLPSSRFMGLIEPYISHLNTRSQILQIGSGTSDLQNHFRSRGILKVTNIDYEPLATEHGQNLEREAFGNVKMRYAVADATSLSPEQQGRYDLVVDKSTCDAIACGGDEATRKMLEGTRQCLADGGSYIALSLSSQRFDMDNIPFDVQIIAQVPVPKVRPTDPETYHYCYLLRPT